MNKNPHKNEFPEVQAAIYRVALSLDSFLTNGIPSGAIHQTVFNGFLQKTAATLLSHLTTLEAQVASAPADSQPQITEVLRSLRAKFQQLIDLVAQLSSFRTWPFQQLRSTISQIPRLRGECVQLIRELEGYFRIPKPFYLSRPPHLTAAVNDFLANLERAFAEEWNASVENKEPPSIPAPEPVSER